MDADVFSRFLFIFSSLFVIVEPFGVVPTFLAITKPHSNFEIKRIALRATIFGALILILFSLFGAGLFRFLQIDLNAFRAAGGVLLFLTALGMLRGDKSSCARCTPEEISSVRENEDLSLVPLAIPMLSGPGAITSVMVFSTDHSNNHLLNFAVLFVAIVVVFVISYFVLRSAILIKAVLKDSGIMVLQRIMGLLLASLSLQFIVQGLLKLFEAYR